MSSSTRRRFLQSGTVTLGLGLAGCSALGGSAESPDAPSQQVGGVGVLNDTADSVTASVLIIRDGEQLYWKTHELAGDSGSSDNPAGLHLTPPAYDGGAGKYTIGVRMGESESGAVLDVREMAEEAPDKDGCYFILARLTPDGPTFGQGTSDEQTNCTE